jgi:hypothetical protein
VRIVIHVLLHSAVPTTYPQTSHDHSKAVIPRVSICQYTIGHSITLTYQELIYVTRRFLGISVLHNPEETPVHLQQTRSLFAMSGNNNWDPAISTPLQDNPPPPPYTARQNRTVNQWLRLTQSTGQPARLAFNNQPPQYHHPANATHNTAHTVIQSPTAHPSGNESAVNVDMTLSFTATCSARSDILQVVLSIISVVAFVHLLVLGWMIILGYR